MYIHNYKKPLNSGFQSVDKVNFEFVYTLFSLIYLESTSQTVLKTLIKQFNSESKTQRQIQRSMKDLSTA